jgi:hypothetical protein
MNIVSVLTLAMGGPLIKYLSGGSFSTMVIVVV